MNKHRILFCFFIFVLTSTVFTQAQNNDTKTETLSSLINVLENRYNVSFSYIDSLVENETTTIPPADLSLQETILFLNENSSLQFKILSENLIVIQSKSILNEDPFQSLEEVIITNYLTKGISLTNVGSIGLTPKDFGILPGLIEPDILQTIQAFPGISSIDETVSNVNVRGGTHDQNLILWDGIKMYQSGHFFGLISAFNPYLTKRVDIYKNGTSARFSDGVSSTIDIKLDNELNTEFSGGAGFNLIHADGFAKMPLGKSVEFQISARRSITDFIKTPTYNQYFDRIFQDTDLTNNESNINSTITTNEDFYFYDLSSKLLFNISEKDKVSISFLNVYNNLDYIEEAIINNTNEALESGITQSNLAGRLHYERIWNSKFSSDIQVYGSQYDLKARNFDIINEQRLIQENDVLDTGIKMDTKYNINNKMTLLNGYHFSEVGVSNLQDVNNPLFRSNIKGVLKSHSLYSEISYKSENKNTFARFGVRGNYFSKFDKLIIEPRLSFSQYFLDHFRLEVLGEYKNQTTSQIIDLQNDFLGIEKRRWVLADNESIPVITSKQASVGIHYNKNGLLLSLEGYYKDVDNITTRSQGFQNQYQFIQAIGNYRVKGIDFLINKRFKDFSTWLSYSYSKNDYTFKDLNDNLDFPNNADLRHAISFAGTYNLNAFKFALGINWRSGIPTTNPQADVSVISGEINYESPNSSNLNDYFRTDFSASYHFNFNSTIKGNVGLALWNILNKKNTLNRYHNIDINDNSITTIENKSLGLTPNVSLRVNF